MGSGHQALLEEEVSRLERELDVVQQEREVVKKVWASFRKNPDEVSGDRPAWARLSDQVDVPSVGGVGEWLLRLETAASEATSASRSAASGPHPAGAGPPITRSKAADDPGEVAEQGPVRVNAWCG